LGLQIALNFVPATIYGNVVVVGGEVEFFVVLNVREWFTPKNFGAGSLTSTYRVGRKYNFKS